MLGAEVSARFALPPNSREYCGKPSFRRALAAYLLGKTPARKRALEAEIGKFFAHHAYLKLIADANGRSPFDAKVSEALWLGNGLLEKVGRKDLQRLILRDFVGEGKLGKKRAAELAKKMPGGFLAHHTFHVLYIHTISGVIEPSVENADLCRVSWGRVKRAGRSYAVLESQKLVKKKGKLALVPFSRKVSLSAAGIALVPEVKTGDNVASHWDVAVMKLSKKQAGMLEKVTRHNVEIANRA